jgi:hypothetical protein
MPKSQQEKRDEYERNKIASDAAFMRDPDNWPRWPVLPVVERHTSGGTRRVGLMRESGTPEVYVGVNLNDLVTGNLADQLAKATEVKSYDTFESCALEWRVD